MVEDNALPILARKLFNIQSNSKVMDWIKIELENNGKLFDIDYLCANGLQKTHTIFYWMNATRHTNQWITFKHMLWTQSLHGMLNNYL